MVAHQDVLYIFGGMIDSGSNEDDTPLWLYDIDSSTWCHNKAAEDKEARPTNRKGHSAVVYQAGMYIFGGYFDIKGAVEEFWMFSFGSEKWSALSPRTRGMGPGPRHGHASATFNSAMYLFGGLKQMAEQNDFWKFDFRRHHWSSIKTSSGPPKVVGHACVIHQNSLWLVGGGLPYRCPTGNLWRFHFHSRSWKKVPKGKEDSEVAKMYHSAIGVPGLLPRAPDMTCLEVGISATKPASLHKWGTNKVANTPNTEDIEMKTFKQFPSTPLFCSCSFNNLDQTDEQQLLSSCRNDDEPVTYVNAIEEEEAVSQPNRTKPDLLIIGGKPLSRNCRISVWQLKLCQVAI
ncbi:ras guanine nucleotide exchange factor F [Bombina bombina]|uniref:ras guanine nucleotide exchange factor F n=1 Tax=Bombina bombina TaxID=8345 RepID=UPI00235A613C|nr:ras guanine nucleotide exchange factor F [Bombina bombina]